MSARSKGIKDPRVGQRIKWLKNGKSYKGKVVSVNQRMVKILRSDGEIFELYKSAWGLIFIPEAL